MTTASVQARRRTPPAARRRSFHGGAVEVLDVQPLAVAGADQDVGAAAHLPRAVADDGELGAVGVLDDDPGEQPRLSRGPALAAAEPVQHRRDRQRLPRRHQVGDVGGLVVALAGVAVVADPVGPGTVEVELGGMARGQVAPGAHDLAVRYVDDGAGQRVLVRLAGRSCRGPTGRGRPRSPPGRGRWSRRGRSPGRRRSRRARRWPRGSRWCRRGNRSPTGRSRCRRPCPSMLVRKVWPSDPDAQLVGDAGVDHVGDGPPRVGRERTATIRWVLSALSVACSCHM